MPRDLLSLRWLFSALLTFCSLTLSSTQQACSAPFTFRDGDRVVFLGDGLLEQEQYFGWIEVMLTTAHPKLDLTFRNLGWNGDTPAGASRFGLSLLQAGREPADEGWKQLQKQLELTQPTVLILGYGMASSLEGGRAGLETFVGEYEQLLRAARRISPGVRFVCLSPLHPIQGDESRMQTARAYGEAVRRVAQQHEAHFVDLSQTAQSQEMRKDPIHLNSAGYRAAAEAIRQALEQPPSDWQTSPQTEALRRAILRKNEWWFHRSRPANMAYVFGFRKHEQGQNAVEIPQFDELIAREEEKIAQLRAFEPTTLPEPAPTLESKYAKFVEQPTPEFTVADGWEVTLWAQNPMLNKPIHMNFDPQGRLWIASSEAYPMIEVGQSAPDKIVVLEDTTADGRADQAHVFADGLLIPTGIAPGEGGVFVAQSTDLLFLEDTDGDGQADRKERVLSGFGTEDTHHNLHSLRWGPDGRLYMNQSVYTRTDAETPHGVTRLKAGGGLRYDTRNRRLEIFFRGLWNSWGHQFDAFGQSFLTDGAGFAGIAYTFPGATFNPTPKARHQLDLISPGNWPKFASMEILYGDTFPLNWQGSIITCDFRANRVTRFSLSEQQAGFVTQQEEDLLRTSAPTFRPIDVKQGPDGALYIADWSNPIINHGEVDFRDARRDRWHGRIWRVAWRGASSRTKTDLTLLSTRQLLESLRSSDRYTQDQARRVLIERGGDEVTGDLQTWLSRQKDDTGRLQALWLYQALDVPAIELLDELLSAADPKIRAAAARVLSTWAEPDCLPRPALARPQAFHRFKDLLGDEHPRVRLEAVRGLARFRTANAALTALDVLNHPMDRFVEHALILAIHEAAEPLMQAIEDGRWISDTAERAKQLEFVLTAIPPSLASRYLSQQLATTPIARDGSGPWMELIGKAGGFGELNRLWAQAVNGDFDTPAMLRALSALSDAQRLRKTRPTKELGRLSALLQSPDHDVQMAAVKLAGVWKLRGQVTSLEKLTASTSLPDGIKLAAISAMQSIGSPPAADALERLTREETSDPIRRQAVISLAGIDPSRAAAPFQTLLSNVDSEQEALQVWRGMLALRGVGKVLAAQVDLSSLPEAALAAGFQAARDGGRDEPDLLAALAPVVGSTGVTAWSPDRIPQLVKLIAGGDPVRGETIYRQQELACITCHAIGGVGGRVGPDMTSLGASAPVDYIIESLFDPNAKIKEGFHSVSLVTEDDLILNGIETESNEEEVVLRDASNKLVRVPRADIVMRRAGKSLMPTGVLDRLPEQDQVDLICFLSKLGKPGRFDASIGGVARKFEVFAGTHRIEQQGPERIINGDIRQGWKPLTALVNGDVPKSALLETTRQPINIALVHIYLKTQVEVTVNKPLSLAINGSPQLALWIDRQPVQGRRDGSKTVFERPLETGTHTVLIRLDARDLPDAFWLRSDGAAFVME